MKLSILAGATSQSINVFIQDSTSTTGAGKTGLVFNTSGLTAYYSFAGANAGSVQIVLATLATLGTAYSSGGFKEIDATNMPGWYRLDLPNATIGTLSGRSVAIHLQGATGMAPCPVEIELTGWNNQDAIHGGMSALPNTACTTNASLLTSGTSTDQLSVAAGKVLLQATQAGVTIPTVTTVTNQLTAAAIATGIWTDTTAGDFTTLTSPGKIIFAQLGGAFTTTSSSVFSTASLANAPTGGSAPTVTQIATAVWQDTTAGDFTTAGSIGKSLFTSGNVPGAASGLLIAGSNAATTFASGSHFVGTVDTVTTVTNQLSAAAIATGVWQDTTSGDFTVANSIGKSLFTGVAPGNSLGGLLCNNNVVTVSAFNVAGSTSLNSLSVSSTTTFTGAVTGTNASNDLRINGIVPGLTSGIAIVGSDMGAVTSVSGSVGSVTGNVGGNVVGSVGSVVAGVTVTTNNDKTGYSLVVTPPTAATIATAIWTDTTAGDFTTLTSPGKIIFAQLGGAFTTTSSSIFSTAALANAPTGGSAPTVSQIATAVWQDTTAGDFTTAGSIGKSLFTSGNTPGAASGLALVGSNVGTVTSVSGSVGSVVGNVGGNVVGSVGSVTAGVTVTTNNDKTGYRLSSTGVGDILTTALTESYAADGSAFTLAQGMFMIWSLLGERDFTGSQASTTVLTSKKLDGSTAAMTFTVSLDSGGAPFAQTRAT